jgi:hypothetical protein
MDAERTLTRNPRPTGRSQRRWWKLGASLAVLALGCFAQKPSGETAPSAPEEPPAEEAAPAEGAPAPASESLEKKSEEPASGKGVAPQNQGLTPAPPPTAPARRAAPAKPATPARKSASPEGAAESERAIGGNAEDAKHDAPVLRQRLDRAYRAASPDCPSARERKKAVCDLATQICQLTDRDPNVASVAEYCAEAKERCSEAERRTIERCPD